MRVYLRVDSHFIERGVFLKLENKIVNSKKLYCVGYCKNIDKYILECCVPESAYYNMYYEISEEEFNKYEENSSELDELVDYIRRKSYISDRFLFSDLIRDNNDEQAELKKRAMAD